MVNKIGRCSIVCSIVVYAGVVATKCQTFLCAKFEGEDSRSVTLNDVTYSRQTTLSCIHCHGLFIVPTCPTKWISLIVTLTSISLTLLRVFKFFHAQATTCNQCTRSFGHEKIFLVGTRVRPEITHSFPAAPATKVIFHALEWPARRGI